MPNVPNGQGTAPPNPQVIVELVPVQTGGYRTGIKSNIKPGPTAWDAIVSMLQSALRQASVEDYKQREEGGGEPQRIVVPEMQFQGKI